ncbi:hypothetical protein CF319_g7846 [Tilletia indica]|nr:hypothetical protein CF319_g7846 [Tilletia indica]
MIPASGPGRGSGPSPAQTTRGHQEGTYLPCPSSTIDDQIAADEVLSPPFPQEEGSHQMPVLHLAHSSWLQHPAPLPAADSSGSQLRRGVTNVQMPRLIETGSGLGCHRHAPTTCRIHFTNSDLPEVSSLADTGASLSSIDKGLVDRLGLQPQGQTLNVNGIGSLRTLGFVTLPFSIEATDEEGSAVRLNFEHDFHVLPAFAPGICLGQDWISGHHAVLDTVGKVAKLGRFNFPVRGEVPHARTLSAKICAKKDSTIPPSCHAWVEVDTAALLDDVDYILEPTFFHDPAHDHAVMAVACLMDHSTSRLLVTNFGTEPLELPSRANLGQATALGPGVECQPTSVAFPLLSETNAGQPFDPFEFDEQPVAAAENAAATESVDDVWRVGVDDSGKPHPEIVALLRRHRQAFALDGRPGHIKGAEMRIPIPDPSQLKAEAPRRVSPEKRAAIEQQISQLLEWDVIEDSNSPVSAPVHLVRQRDKLRFCVDYRHLNSATTPDRYPLPRIDDVLESLRGASWFSSLDAIRGYHQMDIAPEDRWKTAFITHKGLMQYKRVPFGLRSAPAFFQRFMDGLLGPMRWITALVYLDDIVVYTKSLSEHLDALDQLLSAAEAAGLRFSPSKCTFAVRELNLLGRKVSGHGLGVMEDRASAVRDLPRPNTLHDLYHVLGLFTYYRQFIPKFAQLAKPLTDLTCGWSYKRVGGVHRLVRKDGSMISSKTETLIWTEAHQLSFDAIKSAIANPPTLAHPDYERPFLLYTDASKTGFAAAIHQIQVYPDVSPSVAAPAWPDRVGNLDRASWIQALRSDPIFGPTVRRLVSGDQRGNDEIYRLDDGILLRKDDGRVCLPRSAMVTILRQRHDDGGHFGFAKTYMAIAAEFWHPRLSSLVAAYVRHCLTCVRTKTGPATGRLDIDCTATRPFEHTSIDVVLGMPRSRRGRDAVLIASCEFSKMILMEPCTASFTAKDVTDFILNRIVRLGWRPRRLTSDRDLRIMGEASQRLGDVLGMTVTATPAHHHQANPVERHIQTVKRVLRAMTPTRQGLWDEEVLPAAELAMNSAPSIATGMTPLDAVFIDSPRVLDCILSRPDHEGVGEWVERFQQAKGRIREARDVVRAEKTRQRRNFERSHAPLPSVQPGTMVWIRLKNRPIAAAPAGKLAPVKLGPFPVRRVLSAHRVLVDVPAEYNLDGEFDLSQLELHPAGSDPFSRPASPDRAALPNRAADVPPSIEASDPALPRRGTRVRRPGPLLRDPQLSMFAMSSHLGNPLALHEDVFAQPRHRIKHTTIDGAPVQLVECPVAFLSRATTSAESKLTGPELELTCIAWAMTRAQHLLEGAEVTVVTDHAPVSGMLSSRTGLIPYGRTVEKARVLLRPHLDNLRFIYKPGKTHTNVDALSRLPSSTAPPGRRASVGGACDGEATAGSQ